MGSLNWTVGGINRDQVANEIATLRTNSPTFRRLEQMAWDKGYRSVELTMGSGLHKYSIADSDQFGRDRNARNRRTADHDRRNHRARAGTRRDPSERRQPGQIRFLSARLARGTVGAQANR